MTSRHPIQTITACLAIAFLSTANAQDFANNIQDAQNAVAESAQASEDVVIILDDTATAEPVAAAEETVVIIDETVEAPALPEPEAIAADLPSAEEVKLVLPTEEAAATEFSDETETISVDFPDEEIRRIIRNVADLYDLNVVIPETLVGNTSLKLRNVTWRQVYDVVLEPVGFTYIEDGNIIKVKSRDELLQEPMETRVFIVDFATAAELSGSLSPLVNTAEGGRIQVNTRSNALIITEKPSRFQQIQEIIERLDKPTQQVMIEAKFVDIKDEDSKNLGINWKSLSAYQMTAGPVNRIWERDNSVSRSNNNSIQTGDTTGFDLANPTPIDADFTDIRETISSASANSQGRFDTAVFEADAFEVILSALNTYNDIELISHPTVVTLNNTPAMINIGEEFPIPKYTFNEERGAFEVSDFEFKPIGIILKVTPQVNQAGFINLDIAPEVSQTSGVVNFGGSGGAVIPIIDTKKTRSTISIKDGYTLAIGGLVDKNINNTSSKVPVLGDIPGIGKLFRSKNDVEERRNLVIFITARTLRPDGSTYEEVLDPRIMDEMGIIPSDIPGYVIPEAEADLMNELRAIRSASKLRETEESLRMQIEALQLREAYETEGETKGRRGKKKLNW